MFKKISLLFTLAAMALPGLAFADGPINLSLFPPIQIVGETESVTAFRLGIVSKNHDMTGLDLNFVAMNSGSVTGVSFSAIGIVDGDFTGWQDSWIAVDHQRQHAGSAGGSIHQIRRRLRGVQFGIVNTSDDFSGLQVGLVNITQTMRSGLQIGLVNIINSKDKLKFFPIVNWSF